MAVKRPFRRAPELPPPRPHGWEMKPLESATTGMRQLDDGPLELTIEHDVIRGVTPKMLHWWFTHIEAEMEHEGRRLPRYLVWHPLDHIGYEVSKRAPGGGVGVGSYFHIQEAFGRNPDHLVDVVDRVDKLDETGLVLAQRVPGLGLIFRLEHRFAAVEGGTDYRSQMLVGSTSPMGRAIFNRVRPRFFPDDMARAWLRHNVEEVGNFEHFLPRLYALAGPG